MRVAGWLLVAAGFAASAACPAIAAAAGFNCRDGRGPVDATVCADARLSKLDSQLAAAYATALARDPAQAAALRADEQDWLAERDDRGWRWLSIPDIASRGARARLARLYRGRIAFLRSLDNPNEEFGSPVVRLVISNALALPSGSGDVLGRFTADGVAAVVPRRRFDDLAQVVAALPAAPDPTLRAALEAHADGAHFTLTWLPTIGLGGVLERGDDGCGWWVPFRKELGVTADVSFPRAEWWGCSERAGRFAALGGHAVVLAQQRGPRWTTLRWWRWSGGDSGPLAGVEVRFAPELQMGTSACTAPWPCAALHAAALATARRYDARPLPGTVADSGNLDSAARTQYQRMLARAAADTQRLSQRIRAGWADGNGSTRAGFLETAGQHVQLLEQQAAHGLPGFGAAGEPDIPGWFGVDSAYFPARVAGRLLLGRIGHPELGWRVRRSQWMVGYWSWSHGALVPVAGYIVDRTDGKPLLAVRASIPAGNP